MAEFYQLRMIKDKDGKETIDLGHLDFMLRRLWEIVSNIDASQKTFQYRGNVDMGGNSISGGPPSQQSASGADFVTRDYLSSVEAAKLISQSLKQVEDQ